MEGQSPWRRVWCLSRAADHAGQQAALSPERHNTPSNPPQPGSPTDRSAKWGVPAIKRAGHHPGHGHRVTTRLGGAVVGSLHVNHCRAVGAVGRSVPGRFGPDPSGEGARFDQCHVDPVGSDLEGQGFGPTLDAPLRGRVGRPGREAAKGRRAGDADNATAVAAHTRQGGPGHGQGAVEVGIQHSVHG